MSEEGSDRPAPSFDDGERRTWWAIVAISSILFVAIVLLGRPLVTARLEAARNLDRATSMIAESNGQLAAVDAAVRAQSATGTVRASESVVSAVAALRTTYGRAEVLAEAGSERLTTDEQKRAVNVEATAAARLEVLSAAEAVFAAPPPAQDASQARRARTAYDAAVEKMRRADAALARL